MKLLNLLLLVFFLVSCTSTDDVDDSEVATNTPATASEASDEEASPDEFGDIENSSAAASKTPDKNSATETYGETANLLYNIASGSQKKSDATLSYNIKCTYNVKPLTVKACWVKTGFLPNDAKAKVGKLLLETKHLVRKKTSKTNEAVVSSNYTCTKGTTNSESSCKLEKD